MRPRFAIAVGLIALSMMAAAPVAADPAFADGQTWSIEVGLGGGWQPDSTAYTRTLRNFGFERRYGPTHFRFSGAIEKIVLPYFSVLLQTNFLERQRWSRDSGIGPSDGFNWSTWALGVHARAFLPVKNKLRVYAQFGVGPTFAGTRLYVRGGDGTESTPTQERYKQIEVGYSIAGLGGVEVIPRKHGGFYVQGGYFYAPAPKNNFGDRHQAGGGLLLGGLSGHFGRKQ